MTNSEFCQMLEGTEKAVYDSLTRVADTLKQFDTDWVNLAAKMAREASNQTAQKYVRNELTGEWSKK